MQNYVLNETFPKSQSKRNWQITILPFSTLTNFVQAFIGTLISAKHMNTNLTLFQHCI